MNRDPRKWTDPDCFQVDRAPMDHVGFGYGVHGCAGQGLARIEAQAVFPPCLTASTASNSPARHAGT
ncbi:cytochrome P450 [Streptomyces sp. 7R007]